MNTQNKPIIWKKTDCLVGQCKGLSTKHWWSIPFSTPHGLVTACYHCGKTRFIEVEEESIKITDKGKVRWEIPKSILKN